MQAMILAAGLGTRLQPLTDSRPKALVEINGTPLLEITIRRLKKYGFNDLIINVHHFADQIIDFLNEKNNFDINIRISDERDQVLETGGGLKKAQSFFNDAPFLLCNTDVITNIDLEKLFNAHLENNGLATLATRTRNTSRYLIFDENNILNGWANVKTGELKMSRPEKGSFKFQAFSGIHMISPELFDWMPSESKFSIIDVYLKAAEKRNIFSCPHDNDIWIDVGKPASLEAAKGVISKIDLD